MTDPKAILLRLHQSLNILQEREAKYGSNTPLDLLHEIEDHRTAIALTEQLITGELTETAWREQLRPLLVNIKERSATQPVSVLNIGDIIINQPEKEPPFWKQLSRLQLVLSIVLGLIGLVVIAIFGISIVVMSAGFITSQSTPPSAHTPVAIFSPTLSPTPLVFPIRVLEKGTNKYISGAIVTIEVGELAPLQNVADTNGFVRFFIDASHMNKPAILLVDADQYEAYRQEIDLTRSGLSKTVLLTPDLIESTPKATPFSVSPVPSSSPTSVPYSTDTPVPLNTPVITPTTGLSSRCEATVVHKICTFRESAMRSSTLSYFYSKCLERGETVTIEEKSEGPDMFYRLRYPDPREVWIQKDDVSLDESCPRN